LFSLKILITQYAHVEYERSRSGDSAQKQVMSLFRTSSQEEPQNAKQSEELRGEALRLMNEAIGYYHMNIESMYC